MPRVFKHQTVKAGDRFGRLVIEGPAVAGPGKRTAFPCVCDCGNKPLINFHRMTTGKTKSCGCLNSEASRARKVRHGMSRTRLHNEWCGMRQRCSNANGIGFHLYGGRGIRVCAEWDTSFEAFRDWAMANGYRDDLTIERVDVNGGYCPENCTWIPLARQQVNRRNNRVLAAFGESKPLEEWARDARCKVNRFVFYNRIVKGESAETAMTRPSERGPKRPRILTAFGETRSATLWAEDPRCTVGYNGLLMRLARGLSPEAAISTPHRVR